MTITSVNALISFLSYENASTIQISSDDQSISTTDTKSDLDQLDSKVGHLEENLIILVFGLVILLGSFGNILVIWTVLYNRHMRTTSNLFILNLAISDLTLCVFSIPFNVYRVLRHSWIFGSFMCKFAPFFQATNVFVSTMSITAIALDRYVSIVCAVRVRQTNTNKSTSFGLIPLIIIILIWLLAFLLSSPLFLFNTMKSMELDIDLASQGSIGYLSNGSSSSINIVSLYETDPSDDMYAASSSSIRDSDRHEPSSLSPPPDKVFLKPTPSNRAGPSSQGGAGDAAAIYEDFDILDLMKINHCIESSPFASSRLIYSYATLVLQYLVPILIVALAYGSIWWKLKTHRKKLKNHQSTTSSRRPITTAPLNGGGNTTSRLETTPMVGRRTSAGVELTVGEPGGRLERTPTVRNQESRRRLKMNMLLTFIAIIFAASWLPLNIFNVLSDSKMAIQVSTMYFIINAICILSAMSSAVSNPFLYGFLNENFKREYKKLFNAVLDKFPCLKRAPSHESSRPAATTIHHHNNQPTTIKNTFVMNAHNHNENAAFVTKPAEPQQLSKPSLVQPKRPIILINNETLSENRFL